MTRRFVALLAIAGAVLAVASTASAESVAGSAGTDTSLPATDTAATLPGRGRFADLRVTVNQTKGLANQALSVTWSGGRPSKGYSANWLQVFQCWGDDDGTNAENPGPPPEQCQFGGEPFGGSVLSKIPRDATPSNVYTRAIAQDNWSTAEEAKASGGVHDPETGKIWKPFRAVDGTVVEKQLIITQTPDGETTAWQNPFYSFTTSNEANWEKTYGEGKGASLFEAHTGLEAPGLGCGQQVHAQPDGSKKIPKCWLVVVPRGTPEEENPSNVVQPAVFVSPLAPSAWSNRIAFPLEFNPIDSGCTIGGDQRRIVGGELAARAVINWQPTLCAAEGATPYAFQVIGDEQARKQVAGGAASSAGMAIVTRPIQADLLDPENPAVYAPITLSGVSIGFNVERRPFDYSGNVVDPAEEPLAGLRVTNINLTPRLVAKLITQSYRQVFPSLGATEPPPEYGWLKANPEHVFRDPDFLRFNPEFNVISVGSPRSSGGLIVAGGTADAAHEVWRWILADVEAREWLDGKADAWGMNVNPYFSTSATLNPAGAPFGEPVPDSFPKNDPYCYQADADHEIVPRPLCMLDVAPLALSMTSGAQQTRAADDRATVAHDSHNPNQQTSSTYWGTEGPQATGARSILSLTDAASAARYGLQTASLSRAGDNGDTRAFVAPTQDALLKGVEAMKPADGAAVLLPDPTSTLAGAYPLTMLTYAAVTPRTLDDAAKADYAKFVTYAAGDGQTPGLEFGDLPRGYAPLTDQLREQSKAAATAIATAKPLDAKTEEGGEAETTADESDRATESSGEPVLTLDTPLEEFTMPDLIAELTRPDPNAPSPAVVSLSPVARALGKTPELVAGFIRFAVPGVFIIGGLALLLFLIFDTSRLRALVSMRDGGPVRRPR